jgi:hypothetical protein
MRRRYFHKADVNAVNGTYTTIAKIYSCSWATARRWSTQPGFPKPIAEGLYNLKAVASWKTEPDILDIDNGELLCVSRIPKAFGVCTNRVYEWVRHPDFPVSDDKVRNKLGCYFDAWWKDDIQDFLDKLNYEMPVKKEVKTEHKQVQLINSIFRPIHASN